MRPCFIKTILFSLALLLLLLPAFAQKNSIKGIVIDSSENKKLHYSIVALVDLSDTTLYRSIRTEEDGSFELNAIPHGRYTLLISYPKMADYLKDITVSDTSKINMGKVFMITQADLLQEVVVRAGVPIRMRGDTLEYTADSFAVRPGANVEELLKRLPGIQVERNGKIFAQGQEVQKLLVDGDEFFSDDPGLATRYLHADAIDKVQVFDQKSDQAQFSGIDDGSRTKTINLKLKSNKKNGDFGKLSTGSNGKEYYQHEAMGALFNGPKKMSVFGRSSKTGEQDVFANDLNKYVAQDYEIIDDGTGSIIMTTNGDNGELSLSAPGIPSLVSGGAHYSDKWKNSREKLFSNYRIGQVSASGWSTGNSTTVLPDGTGFNNNSQSTYGSLNFAQRAGGSFALPLDSFIVIKADVNGNTGTSSSHNNASSASANLKGFSVNNSTQNNSSAGKNRRFAGNITYQQKFRKEGRTFSLLAQQESGERSNDNYNHSTTNYYDPSSGSYTYTDSLNQLQRTHNPFQSFAAKATYTDMLNKTLHISAEYGWKTAESGNVFNTFNNRNGKYEERVDSLSNDYHFTASTQITGAMLSWNKKTVIVTLGGKLFFTNFRQVNNDLKETTNRNFTNFAPHVNLTLKLKQTTHLSISYSGQTLQPSVEQLQPLRRSSSSLYVQIGNPALRPAFSQNAYLNFYKFNWMKGNAFQANVSVNYTTQAITNSTLVDAQNRTTGQYININGIPGINGSVAYNWRYKKIHLNPNISASFGRYGSYTIQNNKKIKNETISASSNFSMGYDWKDKIGLHYQGSLSYSIGKSDISTNKTNTILTHTHTLSASAYLPWKIEPGSDCVFLFQPKNGSFNTSFNTIHWNAYIQKKVFKNDEGIIKFSVNDILNSNTGYMRTVYGSNIYESNRLVIKRYFMLTLTWNFSKSL